jgi:hypothetical protein
MPSRAKLVRGGIIEDPNAPLASDRVARLQIDPDGGAMTA